MSGPAGARSSKVSEIRENHQLDVMAKKAVRSDRERRFRQSQRLARAIRILELIQGRRGWNLTSLAQELNCGERTVRRDLEALELAGVPWHRDSTDNSIRVPGSFRFPVTHLTPDDAMGLAVATAITSSPGLNVGSGSRPTLEKVAAAAGEETVKLFDAADELVSVLCLNLADHSRHRDQLRTAQWALLKHKQLEGQYLSPYDPAPTRLALHPYRICLVRQAWYLVGCPLPEKQPKTYRIARFKSLRTVDAPAVVPAGFSLTEYMGNAWTVYRGDRSYDVRILFTTEAAPLVQETIWHHTQAVQQNQDGSAVLSFTVDGLNEIVWWVLGWSGRAKVLDPPELREMVLNQLETAVELNRG